MIERPCAAVGRHPAHLGARSLTPRRGTDPLRPFPVAWGTGSEAAAGPVLCRTLPTGDRVTRQVAAPRMAPLRPRVPSGAPTATPIRTKAE